MASLLAAGTDSEAGRSALEIWLDALRSAQGLAEIVVVREGTPRTGYRIDGRDLAGWSDDLRTDFTMTADRVRVLLGGGYLLTDAAYHYGDIRLGADIKLLGPLHLHLDVSVATTTITHPDPTWDGSAVVLPGFGAGVVVRKPLGIAQPFGAVSVGLWILGDSDAFEASLNEQTLDVGSQVHSSDAPVAFRIFADGGLDIVPAGRTFVLRASTGVGYGLGLQVRGSVLAGFRFGI